MNLPALRFKDANGQDFPEWSEVPLGRIATFSKGKGISKADIDVNGSTPCIRYGELYTNYGETISTIKSRTSLPASELIFSEANDVIIPASGETQLDIATASCVQISGVALGGDLNIIKSGANGTFLSYYLNSQKKLDIAKLAQGNSVVHLYSSQLKLLDLTLPSKPEQTKIANFLTAVDEKITQLTQKYELLAEYKKGVMQQIFSQELRLKDDDEQDFPEWEEALIGDIFNDFKGSGLSKDKVGISGKYKSILYGHLFTKHPEVINKIDSWTDFDEGLHSKAGDILMPSSTTTTGIDLAKASALSEEGVRLGGDIIILRAKKPLNSEYFSYYLTHAVNKEIAEVTQGITIIHLYFKELKKIRINVPTVKEQTKIATFLTAIDDKLTHTQNQLAAAKQYKQGLLQLMFV